MNGRTRGELKEGFALGGAHLHEHIDEVEEARRVARVAEFRLRVGDYVLACPLRALLTGEKQLQCGKMA